MKLLYFASVRENTGLSEESYELPNDVGNVAQLTEHMRNRGGGYAAAFENTSMIRVAVNQVHAQPEQPIADADEIAFFPPVTGG